MDPTPGALPRLKQPGPEAAERIECAVGAARHLDFTLAPGLTLNAAIAGPLLEAGFSAAQVELSGGAFGPFTYVMPAGAQDAEHAAWYSAPFTPQGTTRLEAGNLTFGRKDGAPFIHCHAFWTEPDGARRGGHVMPHEAVVAAPIAARAFGTADVALTADFDAETNFTLFTPHQAKAAAPGRRIAFARVRPNTDICGALEDVCRRHGFAAGRVRGSVGSLIGARFSDRGPVADYATEVFARHGVVVPDGAGLAARLDIALVGMSGVLAEGRLLSGANPVCITFEVAIEEAAPGEV
ncbi:DUF296 domain-containing protein [Xanthobacter sp. KR7-225]|uniref:PCC domain-containing protein n=1 Tax=Xanthobacter sp. KR7-225 TaxID=3156613 RepID=UPI0032B521CB